MAANFLIFGNGYHPRWPTGKGKDKGKASPNLGVFIFVPSPYL